MTQTPEIRNATASCDPRVLARVAADVAALPAVPSQDWVDRAVQTLSHLCPDARVGVGLMMLDLSGQISAVEAASVAAESGGNGSEPRGDALTTRVRLERLTDLGLELPAETMKRGLATSIGDLSPGWKEGPLGRIWAGRPVERVYFGVAPLGTEPGERALVVLLALDATAPIESRPDAMTLAALLPILGRRAAMAMPGTGLIAWLTDREQGVLDRLIVGRSVREIAEELGRSPHTVHDHVKSLHRKLGASSRGELVARALGHAPSSRATLDPIVIERVRASGQIEPMPGAARRLTT